MRGHLNVIFIEICWKLMTNIWKHVCNDDEVLYDFILEVRKAVRFFWYRLLCLFLPAPFCDISGIWYVERLWGFVERLWGSVRCLSPSLLLSIYKM